MSYRSKTVTAVPFPHVDVAKADDFWQWYQQTLAKGEMTDHHPPIPGWFVFKPASYAVWKRIGAFLDNKQKRMGIQDCAFPLSVLENITTRDGASHAEENIETRISNQPSTASVIYPYFARWITSHRDLPLRLNQWTSAFSLWEPCPQPFLRCREHLVQEAHTAHLTQHDAHEETRQVIDLYTALYEELLAVPVVRGQQGNNRNRASATVTDVDEVSTAVVVGYIPNLGQCIQGGICCELGQSFSKQYGITFSDPSVSTDSDVKSLVHVWQNTWSLSTKAIGLMIATHGDNHGLVLPPRVAENQIVIIPLQDSRNKEDHQKLHAEINSIQSTLSSFGVRVTADLRNWCSPAWKFQEWMIRGVPLRLSLGSEELAGQYVTVYQRDLPPSEGKTHICLSDLPAAIPALLETIHGRLFQKAHNIFHSHMKQIIDWDDFVHAFCSREATCICLAPHCLSKDCERQIEELRIGVTAIGNNTNYNTTETTSSSVKCLCIPLDPPDEIQEREISKCINPNCGYSAKKWAIFGYEC